MRSVCLILFCSSCSLLYDGSDLKGKAAGRPKWMSSMYTGSDNGTTNLATGDVDGDGKLDLVAIEQQDKTMQVYLGKGDGTFAAPAAVNTNCVGPTAITLADLDEDGKADAILACDDSDTGTVTGVRLMASGGGGFATGVRFPNNGQGPAAIVSGDINGDGHADVIIANSTTGGIALFRGEGDGNLTMFQSFHTDMGAGAIAIGDLNGDGTNEVVVSNAGASTLSVLFTQGGTIANTDSYPTDNNPGDVVIGDFDKKHGPDLALVAFSQTKLDVTLNQGAGVFPTSLPTPTDLTFAPLRIATADLDGDGKLDLVVGGFASQNLLILYGKGDGTFETTPVMQTPTPGGLVLADFNGDGKIDIAIGGDELPGNLTILLNQ